MTCLRTSGCTRSTQTSTVRDSTTFVEVQCADMPRLAFYYLSKYALPHMNKGDTIINDASVNAYIGRPDLLDYTSSKGAIVAFTRGLSNQYVSKGIRVSSS